jgi:hypothetical protein
MGVTLIEGQPRIRAKRWRQSAWVASICTLPVIVIALLIYGSAHFYVENLDTYYFTSAEKEKYFSATFSSYSEIADNLSDVTVVTSHARYGSYVTYFDNNQKFFKWYANEIYSGYWYLHWFLDELIFRGRWRFVINYSFCMVRDDGLLSEDNCVLVSNKKQVHSLNPRGEYEYEYARGDIFNLSKRQTPPFTLPWGGMTLEKLQEALKH